jgi:four helix bundle protein
MKESILRTKSFELAAVISALTKKLRREREYDLSKQLFRCGTSVGANIQEAQSGCSIKEFIFKLSIALRECRETDYWIRTAKLSTTMDTKDIEALTDEVASLLVSSIKTAKANSKIRAQNTSTKYE